MCQVAWFRRHLWEHISIPRSWFCPLPLSKEDVLCYFPIIAVFQYLVSTNSSLPCGFAHAIPSTQDTLPSTLHLVLSYWSSNLSLLPPPEQGIPWAPRPECLCLQHFSKRHLWDRVHVFAPHCIPSAGHLNECLLNDWRNERNLYHH